MSLALVQLSFVRVSCEFSKEDEIVQGSCDTIDVPFGSCLDSAGLSIKKISDWIETKGWRTENGKHICPRCVGCSVGCNPENRSYYRGIPELEEHIKKLAVLSTCPTHSSELSKVIDHIVDSIEIISEKLNEKLKN